MVKAMRPGLWSRTLSALLLVFVAWSCVGGDKKPPDDDDGFAEMSPTQQRVIDSVSRTIDTDSLYHVYHSMLSMPHPEAALPLLGCVEELLIWRHGMYPADRAIARMRDTLWRGLDSASDAMLARLPSTGVVGQADSLCGPFGQRGPLIVEGVMLDPLARDSSRTGRH